LDQQLIIYNGAHYNRLFSYGKEDIKQKEGCHVQPLFVIIRDEYFFSLQPI